MKITVESAFDFSDQIVLITGAATGIGLSIATQFASRGARLVLVDQSQRIHEVSKSLGHEDTIIYPLWLMFQMRLKLLRVSVKPSIGFHE